MDEKEEMWKLVEKLVKAYGELNKRVILLEKNRWKSK